MTSISNPVELQVRQFSTLPLLAILALAVLVRELFFTGPLGSDDVVYLGRTIDVAEGLWTSADYNGALRYGYNLPAGGLWALFGPGMRSANLFSMLSSLLEIALVYVFAQRVWGTGAAWIAALIMAALPLHVSAATSIHADPAAALFISLSAVLFYFAELTKGRGLYFLCGLSIGYVFWVKELIIVYILIFGLYALLNWRWSNLWFFVGLGGLAMLFGHFAIMWAIAGNPLHGFDIYFMQISRDFVGGTKETAPFYYFRYLLLDVRHTGLLGPLAVLAALFGLFRLRHGSDPAFGFVLWWGAGLLAVFSFTPISLEPFRFITKQSNYLNLFFAPLALLTAWLLVQWSPRWRVLVLVPLVGLSLTLAGLKQQDTRAFVSNSRAVLAFAQANPSVDVYASVNNRNLSTFYSWLGEEVPSIRTLAELVPRRGSGPRVFAVLDPVTQGWSPRDVAVPAVPACWTHHASLTPAGFGFGQYVAVAAVAVIRFVPGALGEKIAAPFQSLLFPDPAQVYAVPPADPWCEG